MNHPDTHGQPPAPPPPPTAGVQAAGVEETAAARKSLADALHVSFRLLSAIMVLALCWWLLVSGAETIEPEQRAVKLTFGRIQGEADDRVLGEGLKLGWPRPIGDYAVVSTRERTLRIDDLWLYEAGQDTETPVSERETREQGLRPGYDGALMTGDRGLIHIRVVCTFKTGVRRGSPDDEAVIQYLLNVRGSRATSPSERQKNTQEMVRAAVCNAAIRAAAAHTLDYIYLTARGRFAAEVREVAQRWLDEMRSGIHIQDIRIPDATVPLNAIQAFINVTNARQEWESRISEAKQRAVDELNNAAGSASWPLLVGQLERRHRVGGAGPASPAGEDLQPGAGTDEPDYVRHVRQFRDYVQAVRDERKPDVERLSREIRRFGLMNLYATARERREEALAAEILEEINRVLLSNWTRGQAAGRINQARGYSAGVRHRARSEAERFTKLAEKFEKWPEVMLARYWADFKTEVLTDPTVEKWYLPPGQKIVLRVSGDPELKRQRQRAILEAKKESERRNKSK